MQKWEYKFIKAEGIPITVKDADGDDSFRGFEREDRWTEDDKEIKSPVDIKQLVNKLGADGWELLTVVPKSTLAAVMTSGVTTELLWVFKRPVK